LYIGKVLALRAAVENHVRKRREQMMGNRVREGIFTTLIAVAAVPGYSQQSASWQDRSSHVTRFVSVEKGVRLEVLDWGGSGTPVILLAGGGDTAHVFDEFAPKLATDYHVYGITRRGFGASGFATSANPVDRFRDDVLTVIAALKLTKPVLAGHSVAGAELSAVATSHPDHIAGVVYLEAAYPYALQTAEGPTMAAFQISSPSFPRPRSSDLASFSALQKWDAEVFGFRRPEAEFHQTWESDESGHPRRPRDFAGSASLMAMVNNQKRFTSVPVPALILFALPHVPERWMRETTDPAVREAANAYFKSIDAAAELQAKAVSAAVPTARVVRLQGAHYVFLSNEQDTLREMRAFVAGRK
jgi:pimeloyl-ACP methyl ester carboxylesterase